MIRRILLISLAAAFAAVGLNCAKMLDPQAAKDRDLGAVVEQNMKTSPTFQNYIVSFSFAGEPGKYRCETRDIPDAQTAATFAYNAMALLQERNDTKVQSGRGAFTIVGYQNGVEIFEVYMAAGSRPQITLKGPFEGQPFELRFGGHGR